MWWFPLICLIFGLLLGIAIGRIGVWWRLAQIDGALRNLRRSLQDHEVMESSQVPVEWVVSEVETILAKEFRA